MPDRRQNEPTADQLDAVAQLIRAAGRRVGPPAGAYERTLAAATEVWEAKVRRRRQRRWLIAAAASFLVASVALVLVRVAPPVTQPVAAHVDRVIGVVELQSSDRTWATIGEQSTDLRVRDRLRTGRGSRAGVLLPDGVSLRLAEATDVAFESATRVRVLSGKVYVDAGVDNDGPIAQKLEIVTPLASATHIGTQFEVMYRDDTYRLRVREGRVRLSHDTGAIDGAAGDQLSIAAGGIVERARLPVDDDEWGWTQDVAPGPQIDGQAISVLLTWVARETGKTIRFETPEVERKVRTTILHGSIRTLAPLDALAVMLATTDLEHVLTDGNTILIRLRDSR